ncbi:MAG: TPM domain-containing protein [Clostridiales bacterium]|nr:TPM domain-containing protein [Clostridiales bacterium]
MKKILSFLFVLCLCLSVSVSAFAVVDRSESFYVADYSNVLSNDTEQMIINYNGSLEQQCQGAQIVVVTVDYLDGMYSDEYAYQLFNDWGVGSADYNNGMLLLLAVQENKAWLAYGLGLNSLIDSDQVDSLLDQYFWKDFDRGNYDEAVASLFKALLVWYDEQYDAQVVQSGTSASQGNGYTVGYSEPGLGTRLSHALSSIIRILVVIAVLSALFGSGRRRGGGSWLPWFLLFNSWNNNRRRGPWDDDHRGGPRGPGGFGGGGFGGGGFGGGGFGGGSGFGGGGFSGGGGGRR